MKNIILLSLITVNILYAELSMEEKKKILEDKLFARTSKKQRDAKEFYLPLKINKILQDEVFVKIDNNEKIQITKATMKYVASLLKDEYKNRFEQKIDQDGFAPLGAIEQFGIKASYDNKNVMLNIFLPAQIKKATLIRFGRGGNRDINGSVAPKDYAGGVNLYLNQQFSKTDGNPNSDSFYLSSDLNLNVKDFVLEGRLQYDDQNREFTRGRFRVVKDSVDNQLRYKAGDISLPAHNRMSYVNALGVGVEKLFSIGDSSYTQNVQQINSHEFFIQNRSRVEIYINGNYRRGLDLEGGTHNLYDLNLPTGINNVELKIIEDGGKIEYIKFNDFAYSEILKKGIARYGLGLGVESYQDGNKWKYDNDRQIASGYIEYGLLQNMTIEGGLQVSNDEYLAGSAELTLGTPLGLINPYIVINENNSEVGYKKGVDFRTNLGKVNLNLSYEDIDEHYSFFHTQATSQQSTLYRGSLHTQLGLGVSMGLSASSYERINNKEERYQAIFRKNFGKLSTELNFEEIKRGDLEDEELIYATVNYKFGKNYNLRQEGYLNKDQHRLNLQRNHTGVYGVNSDLQYERYEKQNSYGIRADYNNEKFRVNSNYYVSDNSGSISQNIGVQLATGFVFADKSSTITAPITSSFVIVENDDKLEKALGLIGYHEEDEYIYDSYAIDLGDYSERELTVDESNLDFGVDLAHFNQKFISNYKTGSVMDVVVENFYSIKGIFYDEKTQKPLIGKAFRVFNRDTGERSMSFTNDKGEFIINHVGVGTFNVRFSQEANAKGSARYSFTIQENQESLKDMGKIYIERPKRTDSKKHFIYADNDSKKDYQTTKTKTKKQTTNNTKTSTISEYSKEIEHAMQNFYNGLPEKYKKQYVTIEASKLGDGGMSYISKLLKFDHNAVSRQKQEIENIDKKVLKKIENNRTDSAEEIAKDLTKRVLEISADMLKELLEKHNSQK